MKLVLIGDFGNIHDEGMRNVTHMLSEGIEKNCQVLKINTRDFITFKSYSKISKFKPQILHYLTGPTYKSLLSLAIHKKFLGNKVITISSGTRPYLNTFAREVLKYYKPDFFFSQSFLWERLFQNVGSNCFPVPNPVDINKFYPVDYQKKSELRTKYGIVGEQKVLLHVGHIKGNRNVDILSSSELNANYKVIIAGSITGKTDHALLIKLQNSGCVVITKYLPNIEELYQLADAYIFTVKPLARNQFPHKYHQVGVIDMPLSIMEAMSCGLPVITTRIEAIERFLTANETDLLFFDGSSQNLVEVLNKVKFQSHSNRKFIEQFASEKITAGIVDIYKNIMMN